MKSTKPRSKVPTDFESQAAEREARLESLSAKPPLTNRQIWAKRQIRAIDKEMESLKREKREIRDIQMARVAEIKRRYEEWLKTPEGRSAHDVNAGQVEKVVNIGDHR
jgi:hypothetical protein